MGVKRRYQVFGLPLNRGIISDLLLWILLAFILLYGLYFLLFLLPNQRGQSIILHFKDANEISPGSTVRMMGMDIGFVENLTFQQDHVDVKVKINAQALPGFSKLPSGSTFTILFTGLAGDKSIEVEPPDDDIPQSVRDARKPIYFVEEPTLMKDALNAMLDETQALQKGAENIDTFFGEKKPLDEVLFNLNQLHEQTADALTQLLSANQILGQQAGKMNQSTVKILSHMDQLNQMAQDFAAQTHSQVVHLKPLPIAPLIKAGTQLPKEFLRFNQTVNRLNQHMNILKPTLVNGTRQFNQFTDSVQTFLDQLNDPLHQAQNYLQKKSRSQHSGH